jgi:hypothetical protein
MTLGGGDPGEFVAGLQRLRVVAAEHPQAVTKDLVEGRARFVEAILVGDRPGELVPGREGPRVVRAEDAQAVEEGFPVA